MLNPDKKNRVADDFRLPTTTLGQTTKVTPEN
jgi:hypothetical protein